jgi:hypothetical protein
MAYLELVDFVPGGQQHEGESSASRSRLRRRQQQPAEQAEATA